MSGRTFGIEHEKSPLGDQQIGQTKQREELRRVLGQALVANLLQTKEVFNDVERVLNLGANLRLDLFNLLHAATARRLLQHLAFARTQCNVPLDANGNVLFPLVHALVARIAESGRFFTMQQRMRLGDVSHIGRRGDQGMGHAGFRIDTDVGLHAEMPLIALLRLVHLRIALATLVLGRGMRRDTRRNDSRTFLEHQPLDCQQRIDFGKDAFGQLVFFEQPAEFQQGGGVRCGIPGQINAHKSPDGLAVVDGVFHALIGKTEALLGDVRPEHAFQANRWPTTFFALGVERLDLSTQRSPQRHRVDLAQKPVAPRHLLLRGVLQFRKARLHRLLPINFHCAESRNSTVTSFRRFANKSDGMDASPRQRVLNGRRLHEWGTLAVTASLCQSGDVESNHLNRRVHDEA